MNKITSLAIVFLFAFYSCINKSTENSDPAHNSKTSLDWAGHYIGTLPCADCSGIKTHLSLSEDMSFVYESEYLGKDTPNASTVQGTFEWLPDGNTIKLALPAGGAPGLYKVGEGNIFHLDMNGNQIEGELAEFYKLTKKETGILGNAWRVVQLSGFKGVFPAERYPYFQIIKSGTNIVGLNGCNRISGQAKVDIENASVNFGNLITTRMACFGDDIETPFNAAIENTMKFKVKDEQLHFLSESGEILMVSVADWLKTEL